MSVTFNANATVSSTWTDFEVVANSKALPIQYEDDGSVYTIFAFDDPMIYVCTIWKGAVPDGVIAGGYSQVQNDSDKTDFETNYKPSANKNIGIVWTAERAITAGFIPNGLSGVVGGYRGTSAVSLVPLTATTYTEPASAAQRSVSSSSASDSSAGTGTRTLKITYYNNTMDGPFTETVTMNGTTPVNTVATDIRFIEKIESATVGSNGGNVGTITLFNSTAGGGGAIGTVAIGDGRTYWAHHYIRPNRTMFIRKLIISTGTGGTAANISLRISTPLTANAFENQIGTQYRVVNATIGNIIDFDALAAVSGPAKCLVYVKPDATTASTFYANFTYYEI
jgi:hypothetical protein